VVLTLGGRVVMPVAVVVVTHSERTIRLYRSPFSSPFLVLPHAVPPARPPRLASSTRSPQTAEKYSVPLTIVRLEQHLIWRRKLGLDDVLAMAKEVEPEVSRVIGRVAGGFL
jgi:hypothetical protein